MTTRLSSLTLEALVTTCTSLPSPRPMSTESALSLPVRSSTEQTTPHLNPAMTAMCVHWHSIAGGRSCEPVGS
eukprot:scaffold7203_cov416-Prasinococcus_capsulatus_cf.AAC.6